MTAAEGERLTGAYRIETGAMTFGKAYGLPLPSGEGVGPGTSPTGPQDPQPGGASVVFDRTDDGSPYLKVYGAETSGVVITSLQWTHNGEPWGPVITSGPDGVAAAPPGGVGSSSPTAAPPSSSTPASPATAPSGTPSTSAPPSAPTSGLSRNQATQIRDHIEDEMFRTCCDAGDLYEEGDYDGAGELEDALVADYESLLEMFRGVQAAFTGSSSHAAILEEATSAMATSVDTYRQAVDNWKQGYRAYERGQDALASSRWRSGDQLNEQSNEHWATALEKLHSVFEAILGSGYLDSAHEKGLASLMWGDCE